MAQDSTTILEILRGISSKLDDILAVLKLGQRASLDEAKSGALGDSPIRRAIYRLCDGQHTVSEIAQSTGKSISQASQVLSQLQFAGLIAEKRVGKNRYYQSIF
jgi:DNA-binding transcriptional ArsR family regulator